MITTSNILPINSLLFYAVCCLLEENLIHHNLYSESARSLRFSCVHIVETFEGGAFQTYIHLYAKWKGGAWQGDILFVDIDLDLWPDIVPMTRCCHIFSIHGLVLSVQYSMWYFLYPDSHRACSMQSRRLNQSHRKIALKQEILRHMRLLLRLG